MTEKKAVEKITGILAGSNQLTNVQKWAQFDEVVNAFEDSAKTYLSHPSMDSYSPRGEDLDGSHNYLMENQRRIKLFTWIGPDNNALVMEAPGEEDDRYLKFEQSGNKINIYKCNVGDVLTAIHNSGLETAEMEVKSSGGIMVIPFSGRIFDDVPLNGKLIGNVPLENGGLGYAVNRAKAIVNEDYTS